MADDATADLLGTYRRRLAVLEQQLAGFGPLYAPAHLVLDRDDVRREIARLEQVAEFGADAVPRAPIRMLALFAAPLVYREAGEIKPVTLLDVQKEFDLIAKACANVDAPVALDLRLRLATADTLGHVFGTSAAPFDMFHFTGHGSVANGAVTLALEDEVGCVRPMAAAELRQHLGKHPARLAFLSACHSAGLAEVLLEAGVQHVVVINAEDTVLDIAAQVFAARFYAVLLAGRSVREAFERATQAVDSADTLRQLRDPATLQPLNLQEALKFQLLPTNAPIHEQVFAPNAAPGTVQQRNPLWQNTNLALVNADPFVGRGIQLHELARKLRDNGCVAVHGFGGMGKTALAEAAGRWQHERQLWRDGVWLVELRGYKAVADVRVQIATTLGFDPQQAAGTHAALAAALGDKRRLLILDDLDALLADDDRRSDVAALLRALLGTHTRLLVTSRRDLPGGVSHAALRLQALEPGEDVRAFRGYHSEVSEWGLFSAEDVGAVMRLLARYPFAIRLAATYMRSSQISLSELRRRLSAKMAEVLHYPDEPIDRTTALKATLDLSYEILPAIAQHSFALLALFPAGLTRSAAAAILGEANAAALETLRRYSMAEYSRTDERYTLPEPARDYAERKPEAAGAIDSYAPAALRFYAALIDVANDLIAKKGEPVAGRDLVASDLLNIERFCAWGYTSEPGDSSDDHGPICYSARATGGLGNYWMLTGTRNRTAITDQLTQASAAAQRIGDRLGEANVHRAIGDVQQFRDDRDAALASYQTALTLFQAIGAKLGEANVQKAIGDVQQFRDDRDAALASYQTALTLFQAIGAKLGEANVHQAIGDVQQFRKQSDAALASYQTALTLFQAIGDRLGEANVLAAWSRLLIDSDPAQSQALFEQGQQLRAAIDDVYSTGADLGNYAIALLQRGRNSAALPLLLEARKLFGSRSLAAQVEQTQELIDHTVNALLESWPEAVRVAFQQADGEAFAAALAALPAEQAAEIGRVVAMLEE